MCSPAQLLPIHSFAQTEVATISAFSTVACTPNENGIFPGLTPQHDPDIPIILDASIQDVPGGKVKILGDHNIGHSAQKSLYEYVSYSERFPRQS
jgi:hypothetical protein